MGGESSPSCLRNNTVITVGSCTGFPLNGHYLLQWGFWPPCNPHSMGDFMFPASAWLRTWQDLWGIHFCHPAWVGGWTGGREPFWERVLGSVYVCDESGHGAQNLNLCSAPSVGAVLTSQCGVEDHQLSLESFLSHSLYQVSWSFM